MTSAEESHRIFHANFVAEAEAVYRETGLMPRQLKEQRDELLATLDECADLLANRAIVPPYMTEDHDVTDAVKKARAAIAKASEVMKTACAEH